jgi:hypothetical protein
MTGALDLRKTRTMAFVVGGAALALGVVGLLTNSSRFFSAYLEGYMLIVGIALGSTGIGFVHNLTGGRWGVPIRPVLTAASKTLPFLAILFIPILLGMHSLYAWTHPEEAHEIHERVWYLNSTFFIIRAVFYFAVWIGVSALVRRLGKNGPYEEGTLPLRRFQNTSAVGILLFGITISFASFDWMMSLEPEYYSTIFGMLTISSQIILSFSFATLMALKLTGGRNSTMELPKMHDLGNFLLMAVMLWTYLAFSQFLITWAGQLPEEISWYNSRLVGGWQYIGLSLLGLSFIVPFLLLLFRVNKKNPGRLMKIIVLLLAMRWVDSIWTIAPTFSPGKIALHWLDLVLPLGLAAVWFGAFLFILEKTLDVIPPVAVPAPAKHEGPQDRV